jgi:hypothetical protein
VGVGVSFSHCCRFNRERTKISYEPSVEITISMFMVMFVGFGFFGCPYLYHGLHAMSLGSTLVDWPSFFFMQFVALCLDILICLIFFCTIFDETVF